MQYLTQIKHLLEQFSVWNFKPIFQTQLDVRVVLVLE